MIPAIQNLPAELEDDLYVFATGAEDLDAAALDALVCRHPSHAALLTEFAVELTLEVLSDSDDDDVVAVDNECSAAVSQAMSQFNNRLFSIDAAAKNLETKSAVSNNNSLFAALDNSTLKTLARHLQANSLFLIKLRDRMIDPRTITDGFKEALATAVETVTGIGTSVEQIVAHFSQNQVLALRTEFKASIKPEVRKQQSFEEAVRTSSLSAEQQKHLMSL